MTKHSTANHHKVNGLKHQVKCVTLPFWKSEVYLGYQGLALKLPQRGFPFWGFQRIFHFLPFQLLAAISWRLVPFLHLQSQHCISLNTPLWSQLSVILFFAFFCTFKNAFDYTAPTLVIQIIFIRSPDQQIIHICYLSSSLLCSKMFYSPGLEVAGNLRASLAAQLQESA